MAEQVLRKITEEESLQDFLWRQKIAEHDQATQIMMPKRDGN